MDIKEGPEQENIILRHVLKTTGQRIIVLTKRVEKLFRNYSVENEIVKTKGK